MRILGLDVGTKSVKAVAIESAFGRYEIVEHFERPILGETSPANAVASVIQSLSVKPDKIITSLPPRHVTFRNLDLPTKDKKAVQSAITFELEDDLPFELDNAIFDYSILSQSSKKTSAYIAASLKKYVSEHIEVMNTAGGSPDIITSDGWAYRTLFSRIESAENEKPVLLVHLGHRYTTLNIYHKGVSIFTRQFPWGGYTFDTVIASKYRLSLDAAEKAKIDNGFILSSDQRSSATEDQVDFSDTLFSAMDSLIQEIRQANIHCKGSTREMIGKCYLTGGLSLMPGLRGALEEATGLQIQFLKALNKLSPGGARYSDEIEVRFALAAALAITQVGPDRSLCINFRKKEFAVKGSTGDLNFQQLRGPLIGFGAICSCLILSLIVESSVYQSKIEMIDKQLEKSLRGFFGHLSTSASRSFLSNPDKLRKKIEDKLKKERETAHLFEGNSESPLNFLKTMSQRIPKNVIVDMTHFQVGSAPTEPFKEETDDNVDLKFIVQSPEVAEKLQTVVAKFVDQLKRKGMQETSSLDGKTKSWEVSFSGKPSRSSYGE